MKAIVIYQGKYGATQQYAEWIANTLQIPITVPDNFPTSNFDDYDFFIIVSSVYVGKMLAANWLRQNESSLKEKLIIFGVVCMTPMSETEKQLEIASKSIPSSLNDPARIFFLPGRLIKAKLSWSDRFMLAVGAMFEKDAVRKKNMRTDVDGVRRENLQSLLKMANSKNARNSIATF